MVIQVSFQAKSTILSGATKTRTRDARQTPGFLLLFIKTVMIIRGTIFSCAHWQQSIKPVYNIRFCTLYAETNTHSKRIWNPKFYIAAKAESVE
jgi:hypothetical protein